MPRTSKRQLQIFMMIAMAVILTACQTAGGGHSSGRLARVTPQEFTNIDPKQIAAGVDLDSRVPASLNRGVEMVAAIIPVGHKAWEPIGARLQMRPLSLLGSKPDKAAGKKLKAWSTSPAGRLRLAYVLTDDASKELALLQQKFSALLKKYPSGSGKGGSLRIRLDMYRMLPKKHAFGSTKLQTWLQFSVAEGPFVAWDGAIERMR